MPNRASDGDKLREGQDLDEQDIRQRVLEYHQEDVSRRLKYVGIGEERALYLGDYKKVVRDLADPSPEDWTLVRAAMLHIAGSEGLRMEHNRWLGQEIFDNFEKKAQYHLHDVIASTRRDRPFPKFDPQEMFSSHRVTPREATYYYSRAALAVLVSKGKPEQAICLFEELNSIVVPRIRVYLPESDHSLYMERELERLPVLYERVGRFEDALNLTPISFEQFGRDVSTSDVAVRRLEGWLAQLSASGGVSATERCLDLIYEWLDNARDVDEEERDHIGECPTATRQFWAWYYGNALGRLLIARPHLRTSLIDEIEAGEWENRWHVAGILFENPPESWHDYRARALKFYHSAETEYSQQGLMSWDADETPHLSPRSDLYWSLRVGFADAHFENGGGRGGPLTGIVDSLDRIETIASSMAQHVLRTERNTDDLLEDVKNRLPPSREYWHGLLQAELHGVMGLLPPTSINHLIDAWRHKWSEEWDSCSVALCKSVESLFSRILVPGIQELPCSSELKLALHRNKKSPRKLPQKDWGTISISNWSRILSTTTQKGMNESLSLALPRAFPGVDLEAVVNLHPELASIARLRGSSSHDSRAASGLKAKNAEEIWHLVVGNKGPGLITKFCSALGLTEDGQIPGKGDGTGSSA